MRKAYLIVATVIFAGSFLLFGILPVRAQHAGHTPPPPKAQEMPPMPGMPAAPKEKAAPAEVPAEAQAEAPQVEISPEQQQLIGVKIVKVTVMPLGKTIRTVGRIDADERKLATINTKIEGWIEKLHVDYTGRYVKRGEPLAEIYSPELFATQQEFLSALKLAKRLESANKGAYGELIAKDANALVESARERLRLWDITENQIQKIEETGKPVRTLTLYSPVSGYVIQKMAIQGMKVMPGEKLFDIADFSTLWLIADIYEYELPLIRVGDTARIILSYFPGKEMSSQIDYVYPAVSAETRTAKVRFRLSNPGGKLKPQMYTNVDIKINMGKKLAIPESAVIDTGVRQVVYVDKGEGIFEPREVMLGMRAEGFVEVLRGLKAGEKVASSANFLIDSEAQLKGVQPLPHKH
ncbi:MAG TPA: efflux RND transporter periplasmic adaptor subunit [Syntrophales bacterium]|nr:efflux RND transporter periplasmic adaptor subunit [Syntrophales bacterium]